ncbi:MAG: carboxypeptidase-like regulatory domain-containing protein [Egibacteraceae bacterium]
MRTRIVLFVLTALFLVTATACNDEGPRVALSGQQPIIPPEEGGQGSSPPGSGSASIPGTGRIDEAVAEGVVSSSIQPVPDQSAQMQSGINGRVSSSVGGRPIEGAVIAFTSLDDPPQPSPLIAVVTDHEGRYSWHIPPGIWDITVSAAGYHSATQRATIREGTTDRLDFTLEERP